MKAGKAYPLFAGAVLAVLGGGWLLFAEFQHPVQAERVEAIDLRRIGILDGMTFASELGAKGEPADVKDTLVFADGLFVSTECERRCNYPARPYFVRQNGDRIEFVSETRCRTRMPRSSGAERSTRRPSGEPLPGPSARWYWTMRKSSGSKGHLRSRVPTDARPIAPGTCSGSSI